MPWLAQRPGGHPHHVDPGSQREAVYRRLGYVDVPAPGADEPAETPTPTDDFGDTLDDVHGTPIEAGDTFDEPPSSPDRS